MKPMVFVVKHNHDVISKKFLIRVHWNEDPVEAALCFDSLFIFVVRQSRIHNCELLGLTSIRLQPFKSF